MEEVLKRSQQVKPCGEDNACRCRKGEVKVCRKWISDCGLSKSSMVGEGSGRRAAKEDNC